MKLPINRWFLSLSITLLLLSALRPTAGGTVLLEIDEAADFPSNFNYAWGKADAVTIDPTVGQKKGFSIRLDQSGCVKSNVLSYSGGKVKVTGFFRYENIRFSEHYQQGVSFVMQFYPTDQDGNQLGAHNDAVYVYPGSADWQPISVERVFPDTAGGFRIYLLNTYGIASGTVWIADLKVEEIKAASFVELLSNQGFELNEGDHAQWQRLKGRDWDQVEFDAGDEAFFQYDYETIPLASRGQRSVLLTGNYTLASPQFPYHGGKIRFSGWQKFDLDPQSRKNIKAPWVCGGQGIPTQVQIIGLDENRRKLKNVHYDGFYGCYEVGVHSQDWYQIDKDFQFSPATRFIQILIRVFPGTTNSKIWYDDFSLQMEADVPPPKPVDLEKAAVSVDAEKELGRFKYAVGGHLVYNSWFWTSDTQDPVTDYYRQMKDSGIEWVRYGRPFEPDIYPADDKNGQPLYHFERMHPALDHIVGKNHLKLVFTLDGTPAALAGETRDRGDMNYSVVNSLPKWRQFVADVLKHLIDRYGRAAVESWYFELWNEPVCNPTSYWGRLEDYLALYDYTVEAFKEVERQRNVHLRIGGTGGGWTREFIEHCAVGPNAATGETGARCDVLSYHIYCGSGRPFVRAIQSHIDSIRLAQAEFPRLKNVPIINTETNFCGLVQEPQNTTYPGAFMVKAAKTFLDNDVHVNIFHGLSAHPTNQNRFFLGYPTLYCLSGVPSPQSQCLALMMRLNGGERIETESSNDPIESLASMDKDKKILRIATGNFVEDPRKEYVTSVGLRVKWPQAEHRNVRITRYVVDKDHGNAYRLWQEAGRPDTADKAFIHDLIQRSALQPVGTWEKPFTSEIIRFDQPSHSFSLVEITLTE